jgi:hypothetical protein
MNDAIKAALKDEHCTLTLRWRVVVEELLDTVDALTCEADRLRRAALDASTPRDKD